MSKLKALILKITEKKGEPFTVDGEGIEDQTIKDAQLAVDYRATFSSPEGRRVLNDLAEQAGLLASSFVPDDPYSTAFKEGQRNLLIHILANVKLVDENL